MISVVNKKKKINMQLMYCFGLQARLKRRG